MIRTIIHRPVLVSMMLIGASLLGVISYTRLPVELIPYTELPMLIVNVGTVRESDPLFVEQQAVIPLENVIASLDNIERIESFIDRRRATIFVYYGASADQKYAYLKLQERVASIKSELGSEFFVTVWKIDTEQLSNRFMTLQARGEGSLDQIRQIIDRKIIAELENIDGIANVAVYGGRKRSVEVFLNDLTLRAYNITPALVSSKISGDGGARQYLGQVQDGRKSRFVNLVTDFKSLPNLEEVVIKEQGPVLLGQISKIIDGGAEGESIARINGKEAITISLVRDQQANLLQLSGDTRKLIERLNASIASDGVELVIQDDSAEIIEENIDSIKLLALVGGLLAVIILWLFLRNLSLVLIVATSIPISVLIAMNFFYAFDISINTLTLVGVAIAIGMLLDNSIVVLENIHNKLARGQNVLDAVVNGTTEVWRAIVAATLTTVAVFLPFVFSDNFLIQTLGRQVGISIISTLLVSLAVAFLMIPVFSYRLLKNKQSSGMRGFNVVSHRNRMLQIYTLLLKSTLRFPARTLVAGTVAFFLSIILCLAVSVNVSEEVELNSFDLYATLPTGSTLETADQQAIAMDLRLEKIEEVGERAASISENLISFRLDLKDDFKDYSDRDLADVKKAIMDDITGVFPRVDFSYQQPSSNVQFRGGGGRGGGRIGRSLERLLGIGGSEEKVIVRGNDTELLRTIAEDIKFNIDGLVTVRSTDLNTSEGQPGIDLLFDKDALAHFNVSASAIQAELSGFSSEVSTSVSLLQGSELVDIILKNEDYSDRTSDDLRTLQIPTQEGGTVPLMQLTNLLYVTGYSNINRVNQEKHVEVSFRFLREIEDSRELLEEARLTVDQIVASLQPPPGVALEVVHDETDLSEFYFLIFAAVLLIFMILASAFESLSAPLAMMFTIPLATIGAFWGLILTGNSILNANALIGFMILLGVVVNNGIILIDYSRFLRSRGARPIRALLTAGRTRVRPILITAITTILAMLPLAMGKAEYVASIGAPFAVAVIGGLITGTVFTLLIVPTVSHATTSALIWWRQLSIVTKLMQIASLTGGLILIYYNVDSILWRLVNGTALAMVVPAATYFAKTSLKRSRADIIPESEPLKITIRNVVKVFDDHSRFVREWNKNERVPGHIKARQESMRSDSLHGFLWQLPLYCYLFYFTYMYLEDGFYILLFSGAVYVYTIYLFRKFLLPFLAPLCSGYRKRLPSVLFNILFWCLPLVNLFWLQSRWDSLALSIIVGFLWYLSILVYYTSLKIHRDKIEISHITGRFGRLRRSFYRTAQKTPLIGRRKKPFRALNQVSLEIESGMFGLVGPNGAGKTTLMRIICGIFEQSRGTVRVNDIDINQKREELQALIGYLPQEFGTYENMTAYQFLDYQAMLKGLWDKDDRDKTVKRVIRSVRLDDVQDTKIKSYSGGMKQRVGIAQTLLRLPRILVVDEPTAGLDPRERIKFRNLLSDLARDRIVIFSTHIIEDISSSCSRLAVLAGGKVRFLGTPAEMAALTEGAVWQTEVSEETFDRIRGSMRIVHHLRTKNKIRIRALASRKPHDDAVPVTPTLEDSYLWLLDKERAS